MKHNIPPAEAIERVQSVLSAIGVLVSHDPNFLKSLSMSTHGVDAVCWLLHGMRADLEMARVELDPTGEQQR